MVPTLAQIAGSLKSGAVVTDVGSTKREIVRQALEVMPRGCCFIGGHPMAGSEQTGVGAAIPDLFLGATYVITPTDETDFVSLGKLTSFVEAIGARVEVMSPEQHDISAAIVSHLPHAMAAALLYTAEKSQRDVGKAFRLAAGSFKDLTRISDSSPELWRDICATNADSLVSAINEFQARLGEFKSALEQGNEEAMADFFEQAGQIRQTYLRMLK